MNIVGSTKEYNKDGGLVHSCQYHVIFTTKFRRRVLENGVDLRLKELIVEKQRDFHYKVLEMEIMLDHVHLLLSCNPKFGIYRTVNGIKGYSSHVLREEFPALKSRLPTLWTRSKFISSVGAVSLETVKKYIEAQKNV